MSLQDLINNLFATESIGAVAIIGWDGTIYGQTQNWTVNPSDFVNAFSNKQSIVVQNVRYALMQATDERYVATNVAGNGHVVMTVIGDPPGKGLIVAWASADSDPGVAYTDTAKAAYEAAKMM